jgi:hypothetical protein
LRRFLALVRGLSGQSVVASLAQTRRKKKPGATISETVIEDPDEIDRTMRQMLG